MGLIGGLNDFFMGTDTQVQSQNLLSPEQQQMLAQIAALNQQYGGGLAGTLAGMAGAPRTAYQEADPAMLENAMAQIDARTNAGIAGALSSGERFSSGNQMQRARLAYEGGLAKRGQYLDFQNRERMMQMQDLQNAYGQQLQAGSLLSDYLTAPLGVKAKENVVLPGEQGLLSPQTLGGLGMAAILSSSDERLKDITGEVKTGLEEVKKMEGKKWKWKNGGEEEHEGFIAQEVEKLIQGAVKEGSRGAKMIDYAAVMATVINAIKELASRVETIEAGG